MFYRLVAILLIVSVISSGFTRLFIFASFKLNQKYIASQLCENRDKPALHCEGKCYLMKKLKLAEEKEEKQERQAQKNLIQEAFLNRTDRFHFDTALLCILELPPSQVHSFKKAELIFHPPKV